jgi:hypothetical protein
MSAFSIRQLDPDRRVVAGLILGADGSVDTGGDESICDCRA